MADSIETKQVRPSERTVESLNEMNENGMKHRVAMHCCIKLIAHLCLRPRARADIQKSTFVQ